MFVLLRFRDGNTCKSCQLGVIVHQNAEKVVILQVMPYTWDPVEATFHSLYLDFSQAAQLGILVYKRYYKGKLVRQLRKL